MNFKERVLYLAEATEDLSNMNSNEIYDAGAKGKNFDYEKGLDALIKKDKTGEDICDAGEFWEEFNFKKGFDALTKIDKDGFYILQAGQNWKEFDFKKGSDEIIKKDKNGALIFMAGEGWDIFKYAIGLEKLKKFKSEFYDRAEKKWPRNIKRSQIISKEIKDTAKKLPKKTFTL